jgi:hypothetical protein
MQISGDIFILVSIIERYRCVPPEVIMSLVVVDLGSAEEQQVGMKAFAW